MVLLLPLTAVLAPTWLAGVDSCRPAEITATNDAGCGHWFPRFHPKNSGPLAHNNDANAPFEYAGIHHLFMQANFPGVPDWTPGAIGLAHLASHDLATYVAAPPALVPGRWGGPIGGVGSPAGNATGGYYSGSATLVDGKPRIIIPAVFFHDGLRPATSCQITCADRDSWHCPLNTPEWRERCAMLYVVSSPLNLSDPMLSEWSEPMTIVDGRYDGVQPHSPSFDDTTHAWVDKEDTATGTWRFAGQTTVCKTNTCNDHAAGDRPTYLQLFASKNGSDWSAGFTALGDLFPYEPDGEPDAGIMNVPDFWKKEDTNLGVDFLHFGSDAYWLGNYTRTGPGFNETRFVPTTPQQQFGPGPGEGHGYYSQTLGQFVWWGWIPGSPPAEPGVPSWDSCLSVARAVAYDPGLSTVGDFHGMVTFQPIATLESLRDELLVDERNAWGKAAAGTLLLPHAGGDCLDIELNITWPGGTVPEDFGTVGLSVLGDHSSSVASAAVDGVEPGLPVSPRNGASGSVVAAAVPSAGFDSSPHSHGPDVRITGDAVTGTVASWGAVTGSPGTAACNEVAFLAPSASDRFTLRLGSVGQWIDMGWCAPSMDATGKSWIGPSPKWIGFQHNGSAWVYRSNHGGTTGLFKEASPDPPSWSSQGVPYGRSFGAAGQNLTATRYPPSPAAPHGQLEWHVDGEPQGKVTLSYPLPHDAVGCISLCGGGEVATGAAAFPPLPPPSPAPAPPHNVAYEISISSGASGAYSLNGVALAPAGSSRPRPAALSLRVLVDRSVVEGFAQAGRATVARMLFPPAGANATSLVWRPPTRVRGINGSGLLPPEFSVRVWSMRTGYKAAL